jgi:16S rRNA G966 N2-methylase RsmD
MSTQHPSAGTPRHDRSYLLGETKRNDVLTLQEIQRYGRDSFGDADYVSVYGLKPEEWYSRGIRLMARTAVECTRDRLADLIGRDVAELSRGAGVSSSLVVDPFAGSGNTLYWIKRHASARRGVGFELDDAVYEVSRRNLSIVGLEVALVHEGHDAGLTALSVAEDELLIVFVAPPWGDALSKVSGLDLRRTEPPVAGIVDLIAATFPRRKILLAVQVYETVVPDSLTDVTSRCAWSSLRSYDIDAPGTNHGLLLGTLGWTA